MSDKRIEFITDMIKILFVIFVGACLICFLIKYGTKEHNDILEEGYEKGYLDACIDCYNGRTKYQLIENKDGTRTWQKIKVKEK